MHLLFSLIVITMLLALPAIPSFLEMRAPEDDERLHITGGYVRDPRWFGRAFRKKLSGVVSEARGNRYGRGVLQMRSEENVNWAPDMQIPPGERLRGIVIGERVTLGRDAAIRDAYALEHLAAGHGVVARTLTSDATMNLEAHVTVLRWLDADGDVSVAPESDLGRSASSGARITLGENVAFERMWGAPIVSGTPARAALTMADSLLRTRIPAGAVVNGHVKAQGDVFIEAGAHIAGNVIARGDVTLAAGVSVGGHIFSEGTIRLGPGSRVSRAGVVKTVYATDAVILANDVEVFGWVVAENGGYTR